MQNFRHFSKKKRKTPQIVTKHGFALSPSILKGRKELINPQSLWSAVLFVREERLRLECESRVSVSKWEARDRRVGRLKISTLQSIHVLYEYFYTCKELSLLDCNLPDS